MIFQYWLFKQSNILFWHRSSKSELHVSVRIGTAFRSSLFLGMAINFWPILPLWALKWTNKQLPVLNVIAVFLSLENYVTVLSCYGLIFNETPSSSLVQVVRLPIWAWWIRYKSDLDVLPHFRLLECYVRETIVIEEEAFGYVAYLLVFLSWARAVHMTTNYCRHDRYSLFSIFAVAGPGK